MNNIRLVIIIFIAILAGCKSNNSNTAIETSAPLKGGITKVVVDHVVKYRDWCRFSNIHFYIGLHNISNDTLKLKITKPVDDCTTEINNPNLWYNNADTTLILTVVNQLDSIVVMPPHEKDTVQVRLLHRLNCNSIKEIINKYHDLIYGDFMIKSIDFLNNDTINFEKSSDLVVQFRLDDEFVTLNDSAKINKKQIVPPPINDEH